ncbi:MAG: hypothetical protein ACD_8C00023G0001 [uncultured bacterium]|nr:MAG: hypothetical protein ACD_8C00023G0001 [uncultured bacterium]
MLVAIFQIMYYLVLFSMFLMSLFIVFHIVFYAYSFLSKLLMLAIFVPVAGVLLFTNFVLFSSLNLSSLLSSMLP